MKSFTVCVWKTVLGALCKLSLFNAIRCLLGLKSSYLFVDAWVWVHFLASPMVLLAICFLPCPHWLKHVFICYGLYRVYEVVIYQANLLLFSRRVLSYRRLAIHLFQNYVEIIFWFAITYFNLNRAFQISGSGLDSFFQSLNLSFVTMTTFGQTKISPIGMLGEGLILLQSAIGLYMALLVLQRFISILPNPETTDLGEKRQLRTYLDDKQNLPAPF